jgi:hypothetical protein
MNRDSYFAIVVKVPREQAGNLGGISERSTVVGELFRSHAPEFLPAGSRITRSIEITEETAVNGIR